MSVSDAVSPIAIGGAKAIDGHSIPLGAVEHAKAVEFRECRLRWRVS